MARVFVDEIPEFQNYITTSLVCLHCKPGYKPLREPNSDHIIQCMKIEHCDERYPVKWFDGCSKCEKGFSWTFHPRDKIIDFQNCSHNNLKHCLVIGISNIEICKLCEHGYSITPEFKCEKIDAPLCKAGNYHNNIPFYRDSDPKKHEFISESFFSGTTSPGCTKCEEGYVGFINHESSDTL